MLGLACLLCGAGVLWASGGPRTLRRGLAPLLVIGLTMAVTQYLVVTQGLWPIGGMCGGLAGLSIGVAWARLHERRNSPETKEERTTKGKMDFRWALVPYGLLLVIVLTAELLGPIKAILGQVVLRVSVPELTTARGWTTPAGTARTIDVFHHAGALLIYASLITYGLFRLRGNYKPGAAYRIAQDVIRRAVPSSIGIATMVGMAVTMDHAGMTHLLAEGISLVVGRAFPLASPFIGALGAFMTGSNTNSNVVFAALQERVATLVGMSPLLALAAQTTGGAIGGMFAPAKVIVGCAPVKASEGETMRKTMVYGVAILGMIAGVTAAVSQLLS
jgi:lactate permease